MWSDNETATDLLGFRVHADLIKSVVTDSTLLPVVLGVFGEWGGGKSSIMRMIAEDLQDEKHEHTVCLYFNGWMFEGYEDAKTALLSSILVQLGEHKRFGPKIKEKVVGLLKHVKLMEVAKLGVKHVGIPLAAAVLTGGIANVPAALAALIPWLSSGAEPQAAPASSANSTANEAEKINWSELIQQDPSKPDLLEIRKFRDDFEKMLAETDIHSLVILIDDLDRCLPERIIETLEAIKLFVAVPKTAFIIGADPRIVRHAIATRYVARQIGDAATRTEEEYDLVKDYLEKLIQIPYHLPRLSPAEIETYINLLACQKHLAPETCSKILEDWANHRKGNFYAAYQHGAIKAALQEKQLVEELERQLAWSNTVAPVLTEGLKGNPRQIKRMLNALVLRKKLADIAHITIRDEVLAKLMVLEYSNLKLFGELNNWQVAENGFPLKLKRLEQATRTEDHDGERPQDESLGAWQTPGIQTWLKMHPSLSDVDLRDYFWLARDRTNSTLAGVNMVSPLVRRLFDQLTGDNDGEKNIAVREATDLDSTEREALLLLLQQQVERYPDRIVGAEALSRLAANKFAGAAQALFVAVKNAPLLQMEPGIANRIQMLGKDDQSLATVTTEILTYLANHSETKVGKAAARFLGRAK